MAKQHTIDVTVSVADSHKDDLTTVASGLKAKGFVLKASLDAIGVLTGSVPAGALADLSRVPGVASVEPERTDYRPQG